MKKLTASTGVMIHQISIALVLSVDLPFPYWL